MKAEQPIEDRTKQSFVFGTKHILAEKWGWEKRAVWADPENGTVWVGDEAVVSMKIVDKNINLDYGTDWETYFTQVGHPEFIEMVSVLREKCAKSTASKKVLEKY